MDTRTIYYINDNLDYLDEEVQQTLSRSHTENLRLFFETLASNYAMMGIDVVNYPVKRVIQYIEDE